LPACQKPAKSTAFSQAWHLVSSLKLKTINADMLLCVALIVVGVGTPLHEHEPEA